MKAPQKPTDERLEAERSLIAAARSDPSRFAELYENYFERVYAYVLRRVASRQEAEDVTSDVFHQALANIGKFEWRGAPFSAWLLQIAANATTDKWRKSPGLLFVNSRQDASKPRDDRVRAEIYKHLITA